MWVGRGVWVQKKWVPDRVEEQKKWDSAAQRPKILGFRGSKGDLGALGSVKERGKDDFFRAPSARASTQQERCFYVL